MRKNVFYVLNKKAIYVIIYKITPRDGKPAYRQDTKKRNGVDIMENVVPGVVYIGADDFEADLFEGQYIIPNGMAYNSYLILDEKTAAMDTVDASVVEKWMENLQTALDGRDLDYLVVHHMEPDHTAAIVAAAEKFPDMKIVTSQRSVGLIKQFFGVDLSDRAVVVKEGDTLSLGGCELSFIGAPMVHWPEVIFSYEKKNRILFSADAFGKFGAKDFDEDWACEARRYYFNIVGKFGAQVQTVLKKAAALDIAVICPLHGPILKEDLDYYIDKYKIWSAYDSESSGVMVAYCSVYGNTKAAAELLAERLEAHGAEKVVLTDLVRSDFAENVEDAFRYDRLVFCATTYEAGLFPKMEEFLTHLKNKNLQKKKVAFIENGTWAPLSAKVMRSIVEGMKNVEILDRVVTIRSAMTEENREEIDALAAELA